MNYWIPFLSAFFLSAVFTYCFKQLGYRFSLLSRPRSRDIHKKPVPRIGGLAIFSSFLVVSVLVFGYSENLTFGFGEFFGVDKRLAGILIGSLLVTVFMLFDDIKGLAAWKKLLLQIVIALVAISFGIGIDYLANPFGERINLNTVYIPLFAMNGTVYHFSLLSDLLTLIWIVGMMNIINFVDGVDGLASGLSVIASFTIFFLSVSVAVSQPATATLAIILAASSLGFLCWNFPPAKIFMGDSGSMFLGFMLGVLPLISGGKLATVFLVLGFPIVDGILVALGRLKKGKNPLTTPDKTHLHHRLLTAGLNQRQAILLIYAISIAFGWVALRSATLTKIIASLVLFALISCFVLFLTAMKTRKIESKI